MANIGYPAAAPTVSGTTRTLDTLLKQPKVISNLVEPKPEIFLSEFLFRRDTTESGAVIFQRAQRNGAYPSRGDVQEIAPMGNFPMVDLDEGDEETDVVKKNGAGFRVSDEARDRNAKDPMNRGIARVRNALVRQDAYACYNAFIAAGIPFMNAAAAWNTPEFDPRRDLRTGQAAVKNEKLGYVANTVLINPTAALELELNPILTNLLPRENTALNPWLAPGLHGLLRINWVENEYVPEDEVILLQQNITGVNVIEKETSTEILREAGQKSLVQVSRRSIPIVTDPFSAIIIKGVL